jgi:hypothetical protein
MAVKSVNCDGTSRKQNKVYFTQHQEILFKEIILTGGEMANILRKGEVRYFVGEAAEDVVEQWDNLILKFAVSINSKKKTFH